FQDIASHMIQAPRATADLVLPNAAGRLVALVLRPAAQSSLLPRFPPWIFAAVCTTGALLPLQFCGQPEAGPLAVGLGIIPVHADHRMHGFLGGEILTFPYGLAMIRHVRCPMTSCLDKTFILCVGHWIKSKKISGEFYRERTVPCQEATLRNRH